MEMHLGIAVMIVLTLGPAVCGPHAQAEVAPAVEQPSNMQGWLAMLDAKWEPVFTKEVKAPTEAEQARLWQEYLASVEKSIAQASSEGNLDLALAWRKERDRIGKAKDMPAEDEPGTPASLINLRTAWRTQNARIQNDHAAHAKAVFASYDKILAQAQAQLTQRGRLDDALLVKTRREELAKAWLPPALLAAQITSTSPRGQSTGLPDWRQLAERLDKKDYLAGGIAGHKRDKVVEDVGDAKSILVGFDVIVTPFNDSKETVRGIRPVFLAKDGQIEGETYGQKNSGDVRHVVAKPGYAVGAVSAQYDGMAFRRMKVRFDRIKGFGLDTKDSYDSGWIGIYSALEEGTTDTEGKLPVGINVCYGLGVDGIGLLSLKP